MSHYKKTAVGREKVVVQTEEEKRAILRTTFCPLSVQMMLDAVLYRRERYRDPEYNDREIAVFLWGVLGHELEHWSVLGVSIRPADYAAVKAAVQRVVEGLWAGRPMQVDQRLDDMRLHADPQLHFSAAPGSGPTTPEGAKGGPNLVA